MPLLSCAASNFGFILSDFLHFLFHFFPELGSLHFIFWVCIPSNGHFPYNTGFCMSPFNLYVSHPKEMCSSISISSHPCHLNRLLHAKMAWFLHQSFLQCLSGPKGFRQFHFTPVPSYSYWWNKGFWSYVSRFAPHHKEMHPAGSFWESDTAPQMSLSVPLPAPLLGRRCFL